MHKILIGDDMLLCYLRVVERPDALHIKRIFDPHFEAPLELWEAFSGHMTSRTFGKNEIIKDVGQVEHNIGVITKGSVGVFLLTDNHPRCLDLFYEDNFVCDFMSYIEGKPSELFTQALEATEVLSISRSNIDALYDDNVLGLKIMRAASQSLFLHKQSQQIEMLTLTAEERYAQMLKDTPELIHRTASKHIASYLGVTPESLSRIRKKGI